MPSQRIKIGVNNTLILSSIVSIFVFIALFITGGILYGGEYSKQKNYKVTQCYVESVNGSSTRCGNTFYLTTCYKPQWRVRYNTSDSVNLTSGIITQSGESSTSTQEKASEDAQKLHPINSTDTCYYNTKEKSKAQWDKPNPIPGLIVLIVTAVLALIFLVVFGVKFKKTQEAKKRQQHQNIVN